MITAKEAYALSGPDTSDYLSFLEDKILSAANNKAKQITIRELPYAQWLYDENSLSQAEKDALRVLRENGFKVSLYYKELQFVDMGLVIAWG
ncbi:TPA: hypothetical protein ACMDOB_001829 [Vibrio metschnikovii]|uniref:hypothetical protein n=1 Tax=Vibrio TaxID=662 RepID=UPI000D72E26F|nr:MULTISPECIES: hypothetical protein [Vibrio]EKO3565466.1 hypothetical protein [Vibrio metschnikovii]EKO3769046.1 hypothetical protein [Vibrio metschnikovii]MBC5832281.1 hypothetical protein [Vibrio metschnikovii]NAW60530.1 hypothetical protein [Vibrio sp. V31_P5A7T61]NAX00342.1 hypothetical protein [Vibrio sp. V34_P3A8T189]